MGIDSPHGPRWLSIVAAAALATATVGCAAPSRTTAVPSRANSESPPSRATTPPSEPAVLDDPVLRPRQLRAYYGDPKGTGQVGPDSPYARAANGVAAEGSRYLSALPSAGRATQAIILDVDDTSLVTWNYRVASNYSQQVANADYVHEQKFPAVPGMVAMASAAARAGYAIFFLTGRASSVEKSTLGNLTADGIGVDAGFPEPTSLPDGEDGLFTKPTEHAYPHYLRAACAGDPGGKCTTVHYKSATRAHIESQGFHIVANFGDQYSDLKGGHADRTFKLPNPQYYLP